jgi:hypothetical protein
MIHQPENCENRNDPDLVQAFLKKWWVESDFKAPVIAIVFVVVCFHLLSVCFKICKIYP